MRILKSKTFQSYLMLLVFLLLIEITFSLLNHTNIFNKSFINIVLLLNIFSIFIGYLTSLCKGKITFIINASLILIASIYAWIQLGFINYLGVFISSNTSSQFGAVSEYIGEFLKSLLPINYLIFIPFVLLIISLIIINNLKKKDPNRFSLKRKYTYQNIIIIIICLIGIITSSFTFNSLLDDEISDDSYQAISSKNLFLTTSNPSLYVKEYGILSYAFLDLNSKNIKIEDINFTNLAFNNELKETERSFDDTAWKTLIEEETNKVYNNLNNYYINNSITDKNEYTSLFEDKNLIVIMMESVNDIILNEEYFPNFYKLATSGWYFENNYSPRNSCATGNNEFSAMTGLYSIYNNCTSNTYLNNKYFTSIFNLFNNKGYYTNSMHDYTQGYYYRATIHPNMGSQEYYGVEKLGIEYSREYGKWASDEDFFTKYLEIMDEKGFDKPFMSFLTTVSSHQPYSISSPYGDMYLDMTNGTKYSMEIRRYLSKLKVVDNAIGILINGLEERNILDNTVIVLFGDHYPYGISLNTLGEIMDRSLDNYENEKVPLVIYNPSLENKTYNTYTSYLNLTPTLANLFNLDFDPRLYAGVDIFSEDYDNIVAFADSSWKNDKAFYNAMTGKINYYEDFEYTPEELKKINNKIYNKMNTSSIAIRYNYFDYLDKKLSSIKEREEY